jgi:hypothetical protein
VVAAILASHFQLARFERREIVARSLFRQRPVEGCDVAAAFAVAPLDEPVAAALAIGMNADITLIRVTHG